MTEENYNYRTSQTMLRNQFTGTGKLQIPIIPKFQEKPGDFDDLLLIGFDKTHLEDQDHLNRMVHFFLYDYRFERVWKHPDHDPGKTFSILGGALARFQHVPGDGAGVPDLQCISQPLVRCLLGLERHARCPHGQLGGRIHL